ncbi:MAG: plasmid stabilization system [Chitinophagaceae bacterium]|nr:MAG: plasmid stabilization system [Chitinophagaceae bacterium]
MAYLLEYFDEALTDVQEAKIWYKEQHEGLEIKFSTAIEQIIERILRLPTAYSVRYKNIRIAHPKRFPYNIHFYIDESETTVVITAIVHNRRNQRVSHKRVE